MNSGFYAACTALVARTKALDTIANNMANVSTAGFRGRKNIFNSVLTANGASHLSMTNQDANDYGVLSHTRLDTKQGSLQDTGNDLDVALEGQGYLSVQLADGSTSYTRGGNMVVSRKGQLLTSSGDPVLGDGGPITLPNGPVSISTDGTISVSGAVAGHLKIVEFAPDVEMQNKGLNYYTVPSGTVPLSTTTTNVRQGKIEASNVDTVSSVVDLISAQREMEGMRRALSLFNSEMDKTAAQDLPHVG